MRSKSRAEDFNSYYNKNGLNMFCLLIYLCEETFYSRFVLDYV